VTSTCTGLLSVNSAAFAKSSSEACTAGVSTVSLPVFSSTCVSAAPSSAAPPSRSPPAASCAPAASSLSASVSFLLSAEGSSEGTASPASLSCPSSASAGSTGAGSSAEPVSASSASSGLSSGETASCSPSGPAGSASSEGSPASPVSASAGSVLPSVSSAASCAVFPASSAVMASSASAASLPGPAVSAASSAAVSRVLPVSDAYAPVTDTGRHAETDRTAANPIANNRCSFISVLPSVCRCYCAVCSYKDVSILPLSGRFFTADQKKLPHSRISRPVQQPCSRIARESCEASQDKNVRKARECAFDLSTSFFFLPSLSFYQFCRFTSSVVLPVLSFHPLRSRNFM